MTAKLVGYFENWAQYRPAGGKCLPEQIDPSLFTHINFAFGLFGFVTWSVDPTPTRTGDQRLTGDYRIQPVEWNDQTVLYPALQRLKQKNPTLKTLLSIGGWSINSCDDQPNAGNPHPYGPYTCHLFSHMAADPQGRQQFIQSAIAYAHQYGFDGIDIDWEYPGYMGRGGSEADFENFLRLIQEFRAQAGPNFLLTWAAPAIVSTGGSAGGPKNDPTTYFQWVAQCAQSFDWLNVMSYDFHGAFDDPIQVGTGVNAPLVQDSTPNGPFSIKHTVEAYLNAGIPQDKIVLGLPTYGRSFTVSGPLTATDHGYGKPFRGAGPAGPATQVPGVLAYYEILAQLASGELTEAWDEATLTPYAYNSATGVWVSYDNEKSLAYKVSYLCEQELGGAMVWAIDNDAFSDGFPLLRTIQETLADPSGRPSLPPVLTALTPPGPLGIRWSKDQQLMTGARKDGTVGTTKTPALAMFKNVLYCVHEGHAQDGYLWYTTFDGMTWSKDQQIKTGPQKTGNVGISKTGAPALTVFQDTLYCLHEGRKPDDPDDLDGYLWYTTFDGTTWSEDKQLRTGPKGDGNVGTSGSPALIVFQDTLYCLHEGHAQDGYLWYTTFDGTTWSKDQQIKTGDRKDGNVGTSGAPGLAIFQDTLYCVHEGFRQNGYLWYTTFDGMTWSKDQQIKTGDRKNGTVGTSGAPGLAIFQDTLYCVHEGHAQDGYLWYTTFDGMTWSKDQQMKTGDRKDGNVGTTRAGALVVLYDKQRKPQLYCIHEGHNQNGYLWYTIGEDFIDFPIDLLDVWGEGRIDDRGLITGFVKAYNLNKSTQKISNGPDKGKNIPHLVPVYDYDYPVFPIRDGMVRYITLMGAPITEQTAQEMYRVLNKDRGWVMLYDPDETHRKTFEKHKGNLVDRDKPPLDEFTEITISPVYIYGPPRDEL
jgi:GH18 family chitinase